jgi:hypothetical protein
MKYKENKKKQKEDIRKEWTDRPRQDESGSSQFFRIFLDLAERGGNFLHIFLIAQQSRLGDPDGFPSGTVRGWVVGLEKCMVFRCLGAAKPLAIFAILKNVQEMDWRITGLVRNALRNHGLNQAFDGNTGELF